MIHYKEDGWGRRKWEFAAEDAENAAMDTVTCLIAFSSPSQ